MILRPQSLQGCWLKGSRIKTLSETLESIYNLNKMYPSVSIYKQTIPPRVLPPPLCIIWFWDEKEWCISSITKSTWQGNFFLKQQLQLIKDMRSFFLFSSLTIIILKRTNLNTLGCIPLWRRHFQSSQRSVFKDVNTNWSSETTFLHF